MAPLWMIPAAISTRFSHPRRRRSAVRRWLGRLMRLALLFVGADAYIGPLLHTTCVAPVGRGDHTPPFQIPFRNLAGGGHTPGAPRRRPPCSVAPVGGGLRPAPLGQGPFHTNFPCFGIPRPPCRGGPMCPPGHGSRKELSTGRHIGRPLQNLYQLLENRAGTEPYPCLNTGNLPQRASGRRPLRPGRGPEHRSHPVPDPHRRITSHMQKEEAEYRLLFPYSVSWGGSSGAGFPPSAVLRPLAANRRFVPWPMSW